MWTVNGLADSPQSIFESLQFEGKPIKQGGGIKILLRYLAVALLVYIATPDLNKAEPVKVPTANVPTVHSVQLVQEMPVPQPVQQTEAQVATPTPVPNPTPVVEKPKGCEAYREEVAKYNWNVNIAMAIMKAESGCRTTAQGDNRVIGGIYAPSCGLMQIRTLKGRPSCEQLKDPATNIAWAHKLYLGNSWRPWSVYKNGMYKKHL